MPMLPFGEYRPDVADYNGQHSKTVMNVVPRGDGYGPMNSLAAYSDALAAQCRGFFVARKTDGSVAVFAGTSTKLYLLDNSDGTWDDVSKSLGTYSAVPTTDHWQFAQFNNFVFAVQANTVPQVYTLGSSTEFADLGGSPPQAAYIAIVNRFVVLSGLLSNKTRIQWSGLNATTTWTSGVNQSDYQDLPDGGIVRGVAGGEYGYIFQDASIRRMTFAPGAPYVFQIDRISEDKGIFAPLSLIKAGPHVFFLSGDGFYSLQAGQLTPIGKERVDRTFFEDLDRANLQLVIGAADPRSSRVFWSYKSAQGQSGVFDRLMCFDWALQRWTLIEQTGQYIATMSQPGVTLEGLDTLGYTDIDTMAPSFDSFSTATSPEIAGVDTDNKLGFFRGPYLEATIDTSEQGVENRRIFVRGARPITDASTAYIAISKRERSGANESYETEVAVNGNGLSPQRVSTRYSRARLRIPAAELWTYATGVEPDVAAIGRK